MSKCSECTYWDNNIEAKALIARYGAIFSKIDTHAELESTEFGMCRRYPPTALFGECPSCRTEHVMTRFPLVYFDSVCGEFKEKQ